MTCMLLQCFVRGLIYSTAAYVYKNINFDLRLSGSVDLNSFSLVMQFHDFLKGNLFCVCI